MTLTAKQEKFCLEYMVDMNATQAAIRSGYSENTAAEIGWENLRKPKIQEHISNLRHKQMKRTEISADYVLNGIKELTQRCIQAIPVVDEDGNKTGEWRFEVNGAFKGYELLGKHLSLFTDKVQTQQLGKNGEPIDPAENLLTWVASLNNNNITKQE